MADTSAEPTLTTLLSGLRHDLNNPLSIIVAQAELLEYEAAGTPAAARAATIRRAADRVAGIAQTALIAPGDPAVPMARMGSAPLPTSSPRSALVVDDEPELAESLADLLTLLGFTVTVAASGTAAKARLLGTRFDLIVSDLRMPDCDGPGLFAWLIDARPEMIPAMAFSTGDTLGSQAARFLGESARPFMEKPFTLAAVRALVDAVDQGRA